MQIIVNNFVDEKPEVLDSLIDKYLRGRYHVE